MGSHAHRHAMHTLQRLQDQECELLSSGTHHGIALTLALLLQ